MKKVLESLSQLTKSPGSIKKKNFVFGVPLDECVVFSNHGPVVPQILVDTVHYLEGYGLNVEGIFRVSGSVTEVQQLKRDYESGKRSPLEKCENVHSVAGLFKLFIRELPQPLFPEDVYQSLIESQHADTPDMCRSLLSRIIVQLPKANQLVLFHIFSLMNKVVANHSINKMNSSNLAIVLAPNLVKSPQQDILQIMDDSRYINSAISSLIEDVDFYFSSLSSSLGTSERSAHQLSHSHYAAETLRAESPKTTKRSRAATLAADTPKPRAATLREQRTNVHSPPRGPKESRIGSPVDAKKLRTLVNKSVAVLFDKSKPITETMEVVREDSDSPSVPQRQEKPNGAGPRIKNPNGTPEVATMKMRPRSAIIEKENLNQQFQEFNDYSNRKPLKAENNQNTISTLVDIATARLERARILAGRPVDIQKMTPEQLQEEKLAIKRELKSYDVNFARKFGRPPEKSEKEPMRALYSRYREVKMHVDNLPEHHQQREEEEEEVNEGFAQKTPDNRKRIPQAQEDNEQPRVTKRSGSPTEQHEKVPEKRIVQEVTTLENNQEYKLLKQEKRRLQIFLHDYQNEFFAKHGRKVQTREDREPAQHEYERYKVIKQQIEKMEKEFVQ